MQASYNTGEYSEESNSLNISDYIKRSIEFFSKNVKR